MSKFQAIAASALLLFVPGIYLLYLLVMLYISHSETISIAVQVTAGVGLLACVIAVLYPFLCLIMAPSPPKTTKTSAPAEIIEDDAPESEAFESEEVDAFDDELDSDSADALEADSNMEFDDDQLSDGNLDAGFDDEEDDFEIAADDDDDFDTFDLDGENELGADSFDMDMFTDDE